MMKEKEKAINIKYDTVLSYIGEFGRYQKWNLLYLTSTCIPLGLHGCSLVFRMVEPPFRCSVPGLDNDTFILQNEAHHQLVNDSIPFDVATGQYSKCESFAPPGNGSQTNMNRTVACDGWVYDPRYAPRSIVSDMDVVCRDEAIKVHINMVVMLGFLFGSLFGGSLADVLGRKTMLMTYLLVEVVLAIGMAFTTSPMSYMVLQFSVSFLTSASFVVVFVLVSEIVGPKRRTLAGMATMIGWCVGLFVLVLLDYCIKDWRISQIVLALFGIVFISMWWLLDESPRWLLIKGRTDEAQKIIARIAKVNGVTSPETLALVSVLTPEKERTPTSSHKLCHLCANKLLAGRIVILAIGWCACTVTYYGLTLNVGSLIEGDLHLNFAISATMELIATVLCLVALERFGRKSLYCASQLLAGTACLASSGTIFTQSSVKWLTLILFGLGKFGTTFAFSLVYIITSELLPTEVRNSGLGFLSCVGRLAGVLSPYVTLLGKMLFKENAPAFVMIIFGLSSLVAGLATLTLPETRNRKLPETIEDAKILNTNGNLKKSQGLMGTYEVKHLVLNEESQ